MDVKSSGGRLELSLKKLNTLETIRNKGGTMSYEGVKVLVTGGAGFLGSHLVDVLMENGCVVTVFDNLSTGLRKNVVHWIGNSNFVFIEGDCLSRREIREAMRSCELVFHLAANPEVRLGAVDTKIDFEQNVLATYNVLEEIRESKTVKTVLFTSSSTVYGDAEVFPTPEGYGPLMPISLHGASKLACEALITAYCNTFDMRGVICRLANVIGSRSSHGVIWDFIRRLRKNPRRLEILGDGTQTKSYLSADDCVDAFLFGLAHFSKTVEIYNVGSEDQVNVTEIAKIVVEKMNLKDVAFYYAKGVEGGRGWVGDVKTMLLDISKLKRLGWKPKYGSAESVRIAATQILEQLE